MSDRPVQDFSATRTARVGQLCALGTFLLILWWPTDSDLPPAAQRAGAVASAMAILWLTQAVPLAATSLLPLAAFPLLGILPASQTSKAYMNESVFLYLGGFVLALGIERWGLHRRMALHVVRNVGCGPRRLVLGFSLATAFMSMWISNTASALLMVPIGMALLSSLREFIEGGQPDTTAGDRNGLPGISAMTPGDSPLGRLGLAIMLCIAYSASIGGMTTLVGTPTNLAFRQIFHNLYPDAPEISAGLWMIAFIPLGLVLLLGMWLIVTIRLQPLPGSEALGDAFFQERLRSMGKASPAERRMFFLFVVTALLWTTRMPLSWGDPNHAFLPGWGPWLAMQLGNMGVAADLAAKMADDSTVAMAVAFLMFVIPQVGRASSAPTKHRMSQTIPRWQFRSAI